MSLSYAIVIKLLVSLFIVIKASARVFFTIEYTYRGHYKEFHG